MKPPQTGLATSCRVQFGSRQTSFDREAACALQVALPVLDGGPAEEIVLSGADGPFLNARCATFRTANALAGLAIAAKGTDLEAAAGELYRQIFEAAGSLHLYRIWNYVPHINASSGGLENYRRFCRGRSLAFERCFGRGFQRQLPAASAVGADTGELAVGFIAGEAPARHFENPRQIPAFEYPRDYGPRSPSFARATSTESDGGTQVYISGTASIVGHATAFAGDLQGQIACTMDNLRLIGETAGAGPGCGGSGWRRSFKVYIRHAADYDAVRRRLERDFLRAEDAVNYLRADICRADLLLEIDAVLTRPARA